MSKIEAFDLAAQLGLDLPKTKSVDALFEFCEKLGLRLSLEEVMKNGKAIDSAWLILDRDNNELARCR